MNERHDEWLLRDGKGITIMNSIELCSTLTRRFVTPAILVAVLATAGCATERQAPLAAAHGNVGGLTTPTLPMQDECVACEP